MTKLIIAGSRTFSDYILLCEYIDKIAEKTTLEIVSGGAFGADYLGEQYAKKHGTQLKVFKADWNRFGKSAGYKRNCEMGDYADCAIIFWDGFSKGSQYMINVMKRLNKQCVVVKYKDVKEK